MLLSYKANPVSSQLNGCLNKKGNNIRKRENGLRGPLAGRRRGAPPGGAWLVLPLPQQPEGAKYLHVRAADAIRRNKPGVYQLSIAWSRPTFVPVTSRFRVFAEHPSTSSTPQSAFSHHVCQQRPSRARLERPCLAEKVAGRQHQVHGVSPPDAGEPVKRGKVSCSYTMSVLADSLLTPVCSGAQSYISPSDTIQSPATQKLAAFKNKRMAKG